MSKSDKRAALTLAALTVAVLVFLDGETRGFYLLLFGIVALGGVLEAIERWKRRAKRQEVK